MDFFEKLGKKATETFNSAAEKTNKIASETKLKLKINDIKSDIDDVYKEIGKKVYQKFVLEGAMEIKDYVSNELEKITELTDKMAEYDKQILELSNMKLCVKCKNKMDKNSKFCPVCGEEQPEEEVKEAEIVNEESVNEHEAEKAEEVAEKVEEVTEEIEEDKKEDE